MPQPWLQIKGDPMVRAFLFQQERVTSLFDEHLKRLHQVLHALVTRKGVFHLKCRYSSSQLTCWFIDDPYNFRVYVREEVLAPDFLDSLPDVSFEGRQPRIEPGRIRPILDEFERLRTTDQNVYLRAGTINRMNGMIALGFSCDGTHYIELDEFFERLENFGADRAAACA